jgi:iron(III) transport system permease protein
LQLSGTFNKLKLNILPQDRPWIASSFIIAALVSLPVFAVLYLALSPEENAWQHLYDTVLPYYVKNTAILMLGVGSLSFFIGTGAAWLVTHYDFYGKRILSWALLLPFAMPAYVIAYVYTDLLEYAGLVQVTLRELFNWSSGDYWFPEIRSMSGAIWMMSLTLYPYVYMLARAAFLEQSLSLYQASRSLGSSPLGFFLRVSLPMARPAIAVGLALVLMETLNDFGTVDYFAVQTMTAGLYDTWLNMGNLGGAAQIAMVMVITVILLINLEQYSRRKQKQFNARNSGRKMPAIPVKGTKAFIIFLLLLFPVTFGFLVPFGILLDFAIRYFETSWSQRFLGYAWNSFSLSMGAAILALGIGILLTYSKRMNQNILTQSFVRISSLGYAVPGAVLAVGIIVPFAAFDNTIDAWMREHAGMSTGLLLSGTSFAVLFAYTVRFLAVASGAVESSLSKVTLNMDMASRSLGKSAGETLKLIHIPIIRRGALTALLVVFVDCMKELPATLILRPFNFETLATHVYQFASDELLEQCALSALVIVVVGIIPVILLDKAIRQD